MSLTDIFECFRLNLQPRSKPIDNKPAEQTAPNSSIFGSAKPVDTSGKLMEIEKKFKTEEPSQPELPPKRFVIDSVAPDLRQLI